jgi:influenza virus NS1A-binding protein
MMLYMLSVYFFDGVENRTFFDFVLGGYDRGDCLDTIEQFDPVEVKWHLLAIPMTTRRGRVSAAFLKNKIYVCGGSDGQQELNTGEVFDLQLMDKWMPIKDLATPVAHGGRFQFR